MILCFFYWVEIIILFFNVWFFLGEISMCLYDVYMRDLRVMWIWCKFVFFFFFLDNEFIKIYVYYINVSDV